MEQSKQPFPEVMTKEQFINERWSVHSTNMSPQPIRQSQQMKIKMRHQFLGIG
jgi:hypothetical protein